MTQIIGLGGQKNVNFTNWDINQQYRPGDMVVYNSVIYTTTTNIPAGTPWGPEWTIAVSGGTATYAAEANVAFNLDAADPANLTIGGGNVGDVLTTDGTGNVTWAPPGASGLPIANGNSQFDIPVANSTVEITANGIHTWEFGNTGSLTVPGAILPDANIAYDLGSATNRFRDLYLSNNTIYLGTDTISANAGNVTLSGNLVATQLFGAANTVTDNVQSNITTVGILTSLEVTGNIETNSGIFIGDAYGLGNLQGANVTGVVANANHTVYSETSLEVANGTSGIIIPVTNSNIEISANGTTVIDIGDVQTSFLSNTISVNYDLNAGNRITTNTLEVTTGITAGNIESFGSLTSGFLTVTLGATFYENASVGSNLSVGTTLDVAGDANIGANLAVTGALTVTGGANLGNVANITIEGGNTGEYLQTDGAGNLIWATAGGGGGTPAGANTEIQFNDAGAFGANSTFTFNKTTGLVTVQDLAISGNVTTALLPDANVTYDLGSATQRWKDLYLSNNTIYMGSDTISANAGNVTFSGNLVATQLYGAANTVTDNAQSNITSVGTLTGLEVSGNITTSGGASPAPYISGFSSVTAVNFVGTLSAGNSNVEFDSTDGNLVVTVYDGKTWTFDTTGNLTAAGSIITPANVDALNFNTAVNGALTFPQSPTRLSENVLGVEVNVIVPLTTVTGIGSGGSVEVRYTPGALTYDRAWAQNDGADYVNGDQVMVPGSLLGGADGVNDLEMTLDTVSGGTVGSGPQILDSGTPVAGPAGFNIETDGDNWSFSNATLTVPGDIQSDGYTDFDIVCRDLDDDGLTMALKFNLEGTVTSRVELEDARVNVAADDQVRILVTDNNGGDDHRWTFDNTGVLTLDGNTGNIETGNYNLNLVACKSSTLADGNDVSLVSRWNFGRVNWTKATVGYENITLTTNMGRGTPENQWTFTVGGLLQLPEVNNEVSSIVGTRKIVAPTATAVSAPTGTATLVYTPTANTKSYKIVVTVSHTVTGGTETEIFEVFAADGLTGTLFSVSNRLNTAGSNGGANDTIVTVDVDLLLSVQPTYGDSNTVTFDVVEFTI